MAVVGRETVRLGVMDIGSNSVGLKIVDAAPGGPPLPTASAKTPVRLAETTDEHGGIGPEGTKRLVDAVTEAVCQARRHDVHDLLVFATAALRDAPDAGEVCDRVREVSGVDVTVLSGEQEARFTFLAVRRWVGWSAGRLLVLDIGGGSLEVARGTDEAPDLALSLPLGAGRLTREFLFHDPPTDDEMEALADHVKHTVREVSDRLRWEGPASCAVATSKTFKQLARLCGAPRWAKGPFLRRKLRRRDVAMWIPRLAAMPAGDRARLRGVSTARARQLVAGAVTAEAAMRIFDMDTVLVSPWALREGILLRRLDRLRGPEAVHETRLLDAAAQDVPEAS